MLVVCLAAILPYVSTVDDYFVRDDFGVVQLLAQKPASYFPRWFASSWMDDIWGFVADEVRPFPAVSYQLTALGGAASPVLHHVLNILIHAINGLLVMAIAWIAASLSLPAATCAGLVFVLLPIHTESVAWITGRVDSMPALFYLATFVMYARWRQQGSVSRPLYIGALAMCFVALFTKQNTITIVATLAAYDVILRRRPLLPLMSFVRPYVPFAVMTFGYLWLRYVLFGQVAREGALNARGLEEFQALVNRHLTHVVTGESDGSRVAVWLVLAAMALVWGLAAATGKAHGDYSRVLLYFGPVWWVIGVAPVVVAGYWSPRHVYLAAVGWAIVLAVVFEVAWKAAPGISWRRAVLAAAAVTLGFYIVLLNASVREWNVVAAVSHKAVRDVDSAARAAPEGSLLLIGVPPRSWEWALPFAMRPPFARTDLTTRVYSISPRALSCCSLQWFDETRKTLREWSAGAGRDSTVALRWDPVTGALSRATDRDTPQLPVLARALLDMQAAELDRTLERMLDVLPVEGR
jgi:hypothetical protein